MHAVGPQVPHAPSSMRGALRMVRIAIFLAGVAAGPAIVAGLNQIASLSYLSVSEVMWAVPLAWLAFAWIAPAGRTGPQIALRCLGSGTILALACSTMVWWFIAPQRLVEPSSPLLGPPIGFGVAIVCLWPATLCNPRRMSESLNAANRAVLGASLWLVVVSSICWVCSAPSAWRLVPALTLLCGLVGSLVGVRRTALLRAWIERVREAEVPGWQIRELTREPTDDLPLVYPAAGMRWFDLLVRTTQQQGAYRSPADGTVVALIPWRH